MLQKLKEGDSKLLRRVVIGVGNIVLGWWENVCSNHFFSATQGCNILWEPHFENFVLADLDWVDI